MSMIGIYGCDSNPHLRTPGSNCFRIDALAAPAEWILALCFINYLAAMAYILWHAESIRIDMLRCQAERLAVHEEERFEMSEEEVFLHKET